MLPPMWTDMVLYKNLASEIYKHKVLIDKSARHKFKHKEARKRALEEVAKAMELADWKAASKKVIQLQSYCIEKIRRYIQSGILLGSDIQDVLKCVPIWIKALDEPFNLVNRAFKILNSKRNWSCHMEKYRRLRFSLELLKAVEDGVKKTSFSVGAVYALTNPDTIREYADNINVPVDKLHNIWTHIYSQAREKLEIYLEEGDSVENINYELLLTAVDKRAIDIALLYDSRVRALKRGTSSSYIKLNSLVLLFKLMVAAKKKCDLYYLTKKNKADAEDSSYNKSIAENCKLRTRGSENDSNTTDCKETVEMWAMVHKEYNNRSRVASVVLLQRRWYELKQLARSRLLSARTGAESPPHILLLAVVHRFPYIVTEKITSWTELVRNNQVYLDSDIQSLCMDEAEMLLDVRRDITEKDLVEELYDSDDDDVEIIERNYEIIELDNDDNDHTLQSKKDSIVGDNVMEKDKVDDSVPFRTENKETEANIEMLEKLDPQKAKVRIVFEDDEDIDAELEKFQRENTVGYDLQDDFNDKNEETQEKSPEIVEKNKKDPARVEELLKTIDKEIDEKIDYLRLKQEPLSRSDQILVDNLKSNINLENITQFDDDFGNGGNDLLEARIEQIESESEDSGAESDSSGSNSVRTEDLSPVIDHKLIQLPRVILTPLEHIDLWKKFTRNNGVNCRQFSVRKLAQLVVVTPREFSKCRPYLPKPNNNSIKTKVNDGNEHQVPAVKTYTNRSLTKQAKRSVTTQQVHQVSSAIKTYVNKALKTRDIDTTPIQGRSITTQDIHPIITQDINEITTQPDTLMKTQTNGIKRHKLQEINRISKKIKSKRHLLTKTLKLPRTYFPATFWNERNVMLLECCKPSSVKLTRCLRVKKKVELTDIDEVRRMNRMILTAQVPPTPVKARGDENKNNGIEQKEYSSDFIPETTYCESDQLKNLTNDTEVKDFIKNIVKKGISVPSLPKNNQISLPKPKLLMETLKIDRKIREITDSLYKVKEHIKPAPKKKKKKINEGILNTKSSNSVEEWQRQKKENLKYFSLPNLKEADNEEKTKSNKKATRSIIQTMNQTNSLVTSNELKRHSNIPLLFRLCPKRKKVECKNNLTEIIEKLKTSNNIKEIVSPNTNNNNETCDDDNDLIICENKDSNNTEVIVLSDSEDDMENTTNNINETHNIIQKISTIENENLDTINTLTNNSHQNNIITNTTNNINKTQEISTAENEYLDTINANINNSRQNNIITNTTNKINKTQKISTVGNENLDTINANINYSHHNNIITNTNNNITNVNINESLNNINIGDINKILNFIHKSGNVSEHNDVVSKNNIANSNFTNKSLNILNSNANSSHTIMYTPNTNNTIPNTTTITTSNANTYADMVMCIPNKNTTIPNTNIITPNTSTNTDKGMCIRNKITPTSKASTTNRNITTTITNLTTTNTNVTINLDASQSQNRKQVNIQTVQNYIEINAEQIVEASNSHNILNLLSKVAYKIQGNKNNCSLHSDVCERQSMKQKPPPLRYINKKKKAIMSETNVVQNYTAINQNGGVDSDNTSYYVVQVPNTEPPPLLTFVSPVIENVQSLAQSNLTYQKVKSYENSTNLKINNTEVEIEDIDNIDVNARNDSNASTIDLITSKNSESSKIKTKVHDLNDSGQIERKIDLSKSNSIDLSSPNSFDSNDIDIDESDISFSRTNSLESDEF